MQLLEKVPSSFSSLSDWVDLSKSSLGADRRWTIGVLKSSLEQVIQALGKTPVLCFIDALDECEEDSVRDMVQFFERIGDLIGRKQDMLPNLLL